MMARHGLVETIFLYLFRKSAWSSSGRRLVQVKGRHIRAPLILRLPAFRLIPVVTRRHSTPGCQLGAPPSVATVREAALPTCTHTPHWHAHTQ